MAKTILSGIYRIDGPSGKFYVGSAKHIPRRWIEHKRDLRRGDHANPKLQRSWNRHGEENFRLTILERVDDVARLIEREQAWMDLLDPVGKGFNVLPTAGSHLGRKHSEETRRKMSEAHTGRKHGPMSAEQKTLLSAALKGRKQAEEAVRKSAESRRGLVFSDERRAKISAALKGKAKSEAHKKALSKAKIGRKLPEATIAKMRESHRRRVGRQKQKAA